LDKRLNERRSNARTRNALTMEIVNKVAVSKLEVFDLEDYYRHGNRISINLIQWLFQEQILKEKDYREALKQHDWTQYQGGFVNIIKPVDVIIPAWATILLTVHLAPFAEKIVVGTLTELESLLYQEVLDTIDYSVYKNKSVILKGCSKKLVPESAYIITIQKLVPFAKSVMYGEACSAVPLFKKG